MNTKIPSWAAVSEFPRNYVISNQGTLLRVSSTGKATEVSTRLDRSGYLTVRIYYKKQSYTRFVHRLVAEAFLANPSELPIINHKNGFKLDNRLENLEWTTHADNILHAHRTGLIPTRRRRRRVVDKCRKRVFANVSEAARFYSIPVSTCRQYLTGKIRNATCLEFESK